MRPLVARSERTALSQLRLLSNELWTIASGRVIFPPMRDRDLPWSMCRPSLMASDIEGPTDLDGVSLCFETEISRCALDSCMAQQRSNCLQIASAFQNVESLRPA